jgi:hypothetical protein
VLIVAGLAMTTPPSCVCGPEDHFGMLLHPLLPHVHGDPHTIVARLDDPQADLSMDLRAAHQAPGISAATSDVGGRDAVTGLLLPLLLSAALLEGSRRLLLHEREPEQRMLAPPLPPPRISVTLA